MGITWIELVALRRAEQQANSARTRLEVRFAADDATGRRCAAEGCKNGLRENNKTGFCRDHWALSQRQPDPANRGSDSMGAMKVQPASAKRPEMFKAYTLRRKTGGGWVVATVLAQETDIVDETSPDDRQAGLSRIEDELRRLE